MATSTETSTIAGLISWTETGSNKLKGCERITRGLHVKPKIKGENFNERFEAVSTLAQTMRMTSLFEHGPASTIFSPVHDHCTTKSLSLNLMERYQWIMYKLYLSRFAQQQEPMQTK